MFLEAASGFDYLSLSPPSSLCSSSAPPLLPTPSPVFPSPPPNQEDEAGGTALRGEVEKLQVERSMLLETIEDLRQTVEQAATLREPDTKVSNSVVLLFFFQKRSCGIQTICLFTKTLSLI